MSQLDKLEIAGPWRVSAGSAQTFIEQAEKHLFRTAQLDLSAMADREIALVEIGRALSFPEWYGANFDALYDCLTDPAWLTQPGCLLYLSGLDVLGDEVDILIAVLQAAADELRERGQALWCLLESGQLDLDTLPA